MFKKLVNALKSGIQQREPVDPSSFGDPVATNTEWDPAKKGGSNFCTHRLQQVGPTRIEFRMTIAAMLFSLLFVILGVGLLIAAGIMFITKGQSAEIMPMVMMTVIGTAFSGAGVAMYVSMSTPTVLDTKLGLCWKGRKDPRLVGSRNNLKFCVNLDEIHAIQLISEYCRSNNKNSSSYYSYELNFVFHDGRRVNVVDHGDAETIRREAAMLAQQLDVPVWDAS